MTTAADKPLPVISVPVSSVKPYAGNVRLHDERNIREICESLLEFGQVHPLVTWKGIVICGNGRLVAMKRLKWTHVTIQRAESRMTWQQAERFAIKDNSTSDSSEFDYVALSKMLSARQDKGESIAGLGFTDRELVPILCDPARLQGGNWDDVDARAARNSASDKSALGGFVLLVSCRGEQQMMRLMDMIEKEGAECRPYV
jgi:hypothetical protein